MCKNGSEQIIGFAKEFINLDGMSTVGKFSCFIFDACSMCVSAPSMLHNNGAPIFNNKQMFIFLIKLSIFRIL